MTQPASQNRGSYEALRSAARLYYRAFEEPLAAPLLLNSGETITNDATTNCERRRPTFRAKVSASACRQDAARAVSRHRRLISAEHA
jgi:hypothetical protein